MVPASDDEFLPGVDPQVRASLRYALNQVFRGHPVRIEEWLNAPDVMFEGRSPLAVIQSGEGMRVLRALASHDSRIIDR